MPKNNQAAVHQAQHSQFSQAPRLRQRGAIAIMAAVLLPILLAFGALAIDAANLILVKGELQNAADSAAQAGAQCLYRRTECNNVNNTVPDWATAQTRASLAAPNNAAQGTALADSVVTTGYWNLTGTPGTLQQLPHTPDDQRCTSSSGHHRQSKRKKCRQRHALPDGHDGLDQRRPVRHGHIGGDIARHRRAWGPVSFCHYQVHVRRLLELRHRNTQ